MKKNLLVLFSFLLLGAVFFAGGLYVSAHPGWLSNIPFLEKLVSQSPSVNTSPTATSSPEVSESPSPSVSPSPTATGEAQWWHLPRKLSEEELKTFFTEDFLKKRAIVGDKSFQAEIYEIGTWQNSPLYLFGFWGSQDGPSFGYPLFPIAYFAIDGSKGILLFEEKIEKLSFYDYKEEKDVSLSLNDVFSLPFSSIKNSPILKDLEPAPETISLKGTPLVLEPYFGGIESEGDIQKELSEKKLESVKREDWEGAKGSLFYSPTGGYWKLFLPDGTFSIYKLIPPFISEENRIPSITWVDGTKAKEEYDYTERTGCGSANSASVITAEKLFSFYPQEEGKEQYSLSIDPEKDLVEVGKTDASENIYELKDADHPFLKAIYNDQYFVYGEDGKPGVKVPYNEFVASHPLFFWKDAFGRVIKFQNQKFVPAAECGKPVIYLYPETPTNVSVHIEPKGGITVSDPEYNGGWLVNALPDGNLTELSSGKSYPYLFWEGRGGLYETPKKGWVVTESEVHDFLVEKLAKLGLNEKESADFREFWEPRMTGSPYFFITFMGKSTMDQIAPLTINPKPDTVVRILMDYEPLDAPKEVEGFQIRTPQRKGFTVIEWGGVLR